MTAANPAWRISSALRQIGRSNSASAKSRDLIHIEARFAWHSEGQFHIS